MQTKDGKLLKETLPVHNSKLFVQQNSPLAEEGGNELVQLVQLMKMLVSQNASLQPPPPVHSSDFEIEARNKGVVLSAPQLDRSGEWQHELRQWIANVTKTVFSSAFHYYSKGDMSFQQTKIFCSQNIFRKLCELGTRNEIMAEHCEDIDKHLVNRVLPYLGMKYPLTESSEINKKLASMVEEIDNIEEMENNYFNSSKIIFQYRKDGSYYDVIMKVINDLLERIDTLADSGKTHYQQFEKFMASLFSKVYDYDWMTNQSEEKPSQGPSELPKPNPRLAESSHSPSPHNPSLDFHQEHNPHHHSKERAESPSKLDKHQSSKQEREKDREERRQKRVKKEEEEKYKAAVKEYTSFLIGRKVPESVPLFGEEQIGQNKISIKHPAILRILTKWFEELWKKFEKNYFSNRSERIKLQKGENVHDLIPEYRRVIDELMAEQKLKVNYYIQNIQKLNYKLEANIFRIERKLGGGDEMDEQERICGKFAFKVVKNLHNEIVEYLNKVIHSILCCSKLFHEYVLESKGASEVEKSNWPYPPNLISFKVGDLMRCKLSSKEQEVLKLYQQMIRLHQSKEMEKKFRIVRIKNRLKASTNDILINVRFNEQFLCEIQLGIKSHASEFIKASNAFHHYIYELERSRFGPLSELSSIWMSFDARSNIYDRLITEEKSSPVIVQSGKGSCNCSQYLVEIENEESFICDQCNHIRLHNNYILKHLKCQNCRDYFVCSKCRIFKEDFQVLRNKLILNRKAETKTSISYRKLLRDNCLGLINKDWPSFEHSPIKYGISIFIESSRIRIKEFKLVTYNNSKYLLGLRDNDEFYQIASISTQPELREFQAKNILIQINEHKDILQFEDVKAIKEYILPKIAKQSFKKYKENMVLHVKSTDSHHKLTNQDCSRILMTGLKPQRDKIKNIFASDNQLTHLPCRHSDFPNLEWLVLSRNPIQSLEGLQEFRNLRTFVLESRNISEGPRIPSILLQFARLESLQKLVLTNMVVEQIPKEFRNLKNLKSLFLQNCQLASMEHVVECSALEKLNLSNNQITKIPDKFRTLHSLESLILHKNPVELAFSTTTLPEMSTFHKEKSIRLTLLDLSDCRIKIVPDNFSILVSLQTFNLQHNEIQHLQDTLFQGMVKLKSLNLSNNQLKNIPNLSPCVRLSKLYISFNHIQELPEYLGQMEMEEFKFEGCPIKRIHCVDWLKELLDDNSAILQKYLYWYEKIPAADHTTHSSKCAARLLTPEDENEYSSEDESETDKEGLSFLMDPACQLMVEEEEHSSEQDEHSESQRSSLQLSGAGSHGSSRMGNFFKSIRSRVSMSINGIDEASSSESEEEEAIEEQELQSSQAEFQTEDMKFDQRITPQIVDKYFSSQEMFVFDFQSKIKYSEDETFFSKEINLYYDQDHPQIPPKFIAMLQEMSVKCPTLNIYTGRFESGLKDQLSSQVLQSRLAKTGNRIIYDDLRRDRIPFISAATLRKGAKLEIRNNSPLQIPTYLLSSQLHKLVIYKVKSLSSDFRVCSALKELKVRKSSLPSVPANVTALVKLEVLDLSRNEIQTISAEIWEKLLQLKKVLLGGNKLKQMPPLFNCRLLEILDISDNAIEIVPQEMNRLEALRTFNFSHCPVKSINCKEWICGRVQTEDAIIHDSQLSLRKSHNSSRVNYHSHFSVTLCSQIEETGDHEYFPYDQKQEEMYFGFFHHQFSERQLLKDITEKEFLAFRFLFRMKFQQQAICMAPSFNVIIDKWHPESLVKFKIFLQQSGLPPTRISVTELEFRDVPAVANPICHFCKKPLVHPYYWLKWEYPVPKDWLAWRDQPAMGCRDCVEAVSFDENYYKYLKNAVLLPNGGPRSKIPYNNLGHNLQPNVLSLNSKHTFECDGCGKNSFQLGEPRYLCLGCKAGWTEDKTEELLDLCNDCKEETMRRGAVMKKLRRKGHRGAHPLLRILFNSRGYYVY